MCNFLEIRELSDILNDDTSNIVLYDNNFAEKMLGEHFQLNENNFFKISGFSKKFFLT